MLPLNYTTGDFICFCTNQPCWADSKLCTKLNFNTSKRFRLEHNYFLYAKSVYYYILKCWCFRYLTIGKITVFHGFFICLVLRYYHGILRFIKSLAKCYESSRVWILRLKNGAEQCQPGCDLIFWFWAKGRV